MRGYIYTHIHMHARMYMQIYITRLFSRIKQTYICRHLKSWSFLGSLRCPFFRPSRFKQATLPTSHDLLVATSVIGAKQTHNADPIMPRGEIEYQDPKKGGHEEGKARPNVQSTTLLVRLSRKPRST